MKEPTDETRTYKFKQAELNEILRKHVLSTYKPEEQAEPRNIEISEVSLEPSGVVVMVRSTVRVMREAPDKIFKPPTRS